METKPVFFFYFNRVLFFYFNCNKKFKNLHINEGPGNIQYIICNLIKNIYHLKYLPIPYDKNIKNAFLIAFLNVQNIVITSSHHAMQ